MNTTSTQLPAAKQPGLTTNNQHQILGKPVIEVDSRILNLDSGFRHKFLCSGPTFTAGTACAYSCTYCFVEAQVGTKPFVTDVLGGQAFQSVVIRRKNPVVTLKKELFNARGEPKYKNATGVIYGSPLVDIAATKVLVQETIEIVHLLLDATGWDVRLLSKSPLIIDIAKSLSPEQKKRVIFGLSTGSLDDAIARAIEPTCASPTKRTEALRWLQDNAYRTFAMLCPIPPQPMEQFMAKVLTDIRPGQCEHVWAEVINLRKHSMTQTLAALEHAGLAKAAAELAAVSGQGSKPAWEMYARDTFRILAQHIPHNATAPKLRFLQYVTAETKPWWNQQVSNGAIVLAPAQKKPTAPAVLPTTPIGGPANPAPSLINVPKKAKDPMRVAAAHKAWATMRAKKADGGKKP
jgi:DNA repair photolyase